MLKANEDGYVLNEKDNRFVNRLRKSFQYACSHVTSCSEFILYNIMHEFSPVISFVVCLTTTKKHLLNCYLMCDIIILIKNNVNLKYIGTKPARFQNFKSGSVTPKDTPI